MVFISLQISCLFENIEQIKTGYNYSYFLKLRCNNCGESDNIWHDICEEVFLLLFYYFFTRTQLIIYTYQMNISNTNYYIINITEHNNNIIIQSKGKNSTRYTQCKRLQHGNKM